MGGDMTNLKNSNLKVPPLKIVLSSATSGGSDRSSSTSPSSDSESLDSNHTIISENQQERNNRPDPKDDAIQGKFDKVSRGHTAKGNANGGYSGTDQKAANTTAATTTTTASTVSGSRRLHQDQNSDINLDSTATTKEPTSTSNQRITRSSQRAAQQNRSDNCNETNGDDTNLADNQDKSNSELGQRKVKRRKQEQTEALEESNQQVQQQPIVMANICPANYQLPSQNSFELYRDIRNRPHMKMMKLDLVPPRVPHGFKDYIIYGGPYLLDGNKVGLGLSGGRIDSPGASMKTGAKPKLSSNFQRRISMNQSSFNQRHRSYVIPKLLDAPKNLKSGSPLFKLFQDQELARQRMRMQHLKERERSVLISEQEILRAYNQVTIADNQQTLHLSACTYFYYQERYHYVDEKSNYLDSINQKDSSQSRENSDSCNAENATTGRHQTSKGDEQQNSVATNNSQPSDKARQSSEVKDDKDLGNQNSESSSSVGPDAGPSKKKVSDQEGSEKVEAIIDSKNSCDNDLSKSSSESSTKGQDSKGEKSTDNNSSDGKTLGEPIPAGDKAANGETCSTAVQPGVTISDSDLKGANKEAFLLNLQEIDNKWAKIKDEMFVRHKNESDSLYAVQCLEWEWKAKEIGSCDVRLSLKVDPEFVPRVVVSSLDY
uniref:Ankyrin repeat domain-containing protein 12 n=1 Tax=Aceria tosichella TaxID=561515 RepID=A0A6G1S8W0_9ACAR